MDRILLNQIIQILIALIVLGAIAFYGAGLYKWGQSDCEKLPELQIGDLIVYQGNSLAPIPQIGTEIFYAKVTAYNSVPGQTDSTPFIMASGNRVYDGAIACPTYLSLGSLLVIENKVYRCEDRTHPKHDGIFDIWVETREEAMAWGNPIKEIVLLTF